MLATLKEKSQVTIPKSLVNQLGLKQGDSFDVIASNGVITLVPMELYPKPTMDKIKKSIADSKGNAEAQATALDAVRELFGSMAETNMSAASFAASKQNDLELE